MFYQVFHPWHWLTYGQNATALQALAAVIATIAAIAAALYAKGAYDESREQVRIAQQHLNLAQELGGNDRDRFELERAAHRRSEEQLEILRQDAAANRERLSHEQAAEERARKVEMEDKMRAEDARRPQFHWDGSSTGLRSSVNIRNVGETAAIALQIRSPVDDRLLAKADLLRPDGVIHFDMERRLFEAGFHLEFRTEYGTNWVLHLPVGTRQVEEVISRRPADEAMNLASG